MDWNSKEGRALLWNKFPALGPSLNEWALNSGGSGYRKWAITMASMHEIVGAFAPLLEVK